MKSNITEINKSSIKDRLIVALDMDSPEGAIALVMALKKSVSTFKVGSRLFTKAGPGIVQKIHDLGGRVFLDLKYHDIPSTVGKAGIEAARLGVFMFNVHVAGGGTMMRRCVEMVSDTCEREGLPRPLILGVTLLTSICEETLRDDIGVSRSIPEQVVHFARLAQEKGLNGVVASAHEIQEIRKACGRDFLIVTPGIRPSGTAADDQSRIAAPAWAMEQGADYLVVGRPITEAPDPLKAAHEILYEMHKVRGESYS
ncbi:MAG: orotidine-5'-phosphate decarboxylase [Nitrospirae bacterium CG_4_9_14_3_um_filter_53_35]|nr:MAG: orotidine 5'-phosphate decarboxylase [Nitrospirae bacterium CG2_30_53_67]PIS37494.1 MAG: orotidine-5'-phosphate decarboxylase [Nitrospirae bacterium CG08_land_8_20_14_0_20_52_24]PIV85009.1 MAG: orotidine-5'-phosphate decarboxylase [Nitrospirae bacterium CG17_big_fil_post_rev_8_21_14_2_50_50_9]PIW84159.1 MAG: orotidine-5'-phosphate decarboxylase [Nitrospirae bacterium CG_4_8_14_3_um_filter_50_41]PIX86144.1 MAG: orotidine-5'-phosphate decarboxylase [Nitrospirae bacterium CG_4_10_14_3_um_f